jgi:hypothetical protein
MSPARHPLTRRAWLTAIGGLLAFGGGAYHWRRLRRPIADDLAAFLRRRVSYLDLDSSAPEEFAREYVRRFGALAMAQHHRATLGGFVSANALRWVAPSRARLVQAFERRTVSYFLRSTSYFREPAAPVRYIAFPDPYEGPCANPFATLGLE